MAEKVEIDVIANDMTSGVIQNITSLLGGGLVSAATIAGAAIAAAFGAAIAITLDLAKAGGEAELSFARFEGLLETSSLKSYKDEMIKMAEALSKTTRFEDEAILEAEAMIATFDTVSQETFPSVLDAALDLAEFMKTDATSAAQTLGRSFADIEGGSLSLLQRSRLLTKEEIDLAEKMAKAGNVAGAQAFVIEKLDGKIGGLAENMANTYAGQLQIFKNNLSNIKEEMGAKLLPVLTPVIEKFSEFALDVMPVLIDVFENKFLPAVEFVADEFSRLLSLFKLGGMRAVADELTEKFGKMWDAIHTSIRNIDWKKVDDELSKAIGKVDWHKFGVSIGDAMRDVLDTAMDLLKDFDMSETADAIGTAFAETVVGAIDDQQTWSSVKAVWADNWEQFKLLIVNLIKLEKKVISDAMRYLGINMMIEFYSGIVNNVALIISGLNALKIEMEAKVISLKRAFLQHIGQIVTGTIRRILDGVTPVVDAVTELISMIKGAITPIAIPISLPNPRKLLEQVEEILAILGMLDGKGTKGGKGTGGGGGGHGGSGSSNVPSMADGGIVVGPESGYPAVLHGTEAVIPLRGGKVPVMLQNNSTSLFTNKNDGANINIYLTYAPLMSTMNKREMESILLPFIINGIRQYNNSGVRR